MQDQQEAIAQMPCQSIRWTQCRGECHRSIVSCDVADSLSHCSNLRRPVWRRRFGVWKLPTRIQRTLVAEVEFPFQRGEDLHQPAAQAVDVSGALRTGSSGRAIGVIPINIWDDLLEHEHP
jgi:hypothetical protein